MKIKDVVFEKSVSINSDEVFFDERKEVVFVGRSNVGKSSIMNSIFGKKDMVKTSSRPGKTVTANIFKVNKKIVCTDLPGYGFAKLGKNHMEALDALISWYIEERKEYLLRVVLLIDSRIGPQETDIDMYKYLLSLEIPVLIVLSKIDKLKNSELNKSLAATQKEFFGQKIVPYSSLKKTNYDLLMREVFEGFDKK